MSSHCPFCLPNPQYEAWGFSPEGWREAEKNHKKYHICKYCKQQLLNEDLLREII